MRVHIKNQQRRIGINLNRIKKDSLRLLSAFNLKKAELGILVVNDKRMKMLNHRYRSLARTTDVLSFPLYEGIKEIPSGREYLLGDIVINLHAAERQAAGYGFTLRDEVRRLLIHGFLHLVGYDHEKNPHQERRMRAKERELRYALETVD
jgi:probable rRNA maturation factor